MMSAMFSNVRSLIDFSFMVTLFVPYADTLDFVLSWAKKRLFSRPSRRERLSGETDVPVRSHRSDHGFLEG